MYTVQLWESTGHAQSRELTRLQGTCRSNRYPSTHCCKRRLLILLFRCCKLRCRCKGMPNLQGRRSGTWCPTFRLVDSRCNPQGRRSRRHPGLGQEESSSWLRKCRRPQRKFRAHHRPELGTLRLGKAPCSLTGHIQRHTHCMRWLHSSSHCCCLRGRCRLRQHRRFRGCCTEHRLDLDTGSDKRCPCSSTGKCRHRCCKFLCWSKSTGRPHSRGIGQCSHLLRSLGTPRCSCRTKHPTRIQ